MRYQSVIFDQMQYIYDETGFSDHQVHCVIEFEHSVNTKVMEKAVMQLVRTIPIFSRVYHNHGGQSYWEDPESPDWKDLFTIAYTKEEFDKFTLGKTSESTGPQLKVCLLKAKKDALSIIFNHMVTDGAGVKQCIYYLADLYSKLLTNPDYVSDHVLDGDRSYRKILEGLTFTEKCKILFLHNHDNNQDSHITFPMSTDNKIFPFLLAHSISKERFHKLQLYGKANHATVNDILLTAYFRALADVLSLHGKCISIPIMIDMRKYLKDRKPESLTNLSSTVIIHTTVQKGDSFSHTLKNVTSEVLVKKSNYLGLNPFLKLHLLYKLLGPKLSLPLLKKSIKNPVISMTNIGILDSRQLHFEGSPIANTFVFASIKYRPNLQIAITSFQDTLTITTSLYGSKQDQDNMNELLMLIDEELKNTENVQSD